MIRYITAGESHGPGLTGIVEGVPAGLSILEDEIAIHLARRQKVMAVEVEWLGKKIEQLSVQVLDLENRWLGLLLFF